MDLLLWLRDLLTQSLQGMVLELSHLSGAFPADPTSGAVSGQVPQVGEAGQALEPFPSLPLLVSSHQDEHSLQAQSKGQENALQTL